MYFTAHAAGGALAGPLAGGPIGGFLVGMVSHAVLDIVPHHDYQETRYAVLDIAIGILLIGVILYRAAGTPLESVLLWGAVGGVLPDFEVAIGHLFPKQWPRPVFPSHSGLIPHGRMPWPQGFWIQVVFVALVAVVLWATI